MNSKNLASKSHRAPPAGVCVSLDEVRRLDAESRGLSFRARQPARSILGGRNASRLRGRGLDFEELRAYQPGDDVRSLDWRVTARARSPFVRVYREEKERPTLVVVDQRATMFFGSVSAMKSVTAARAAAVVVHRIVQGGDRIGAIVFGDRERAVFSPERSQRQVLRVLSSIVKFNRALLEPAEAPSFGALNAALEQTLRVSAHDYLIVLITDLAGADAETRRLATEIRKRNDLIILWIHDRLESDLPDVGQAVLGDGSFQVQVETGQAAVRERFAEDALDRQDRARTLALHHDVPFVRLSTADDVVSTLRAQLERGRTRRRG